MGGGGIESLQTILICLVGELAGEGYVNVAVDVNDMWLVTVFFWNASDTWHVTCHLTHNFFLLFSFMSFISFGAIFLTHQGIYSLPYADFFLKFHISPGWYEFTPPNRNQALWWCVPFLGGGTKKVKTVSKNYRKKKFRFSKYIILKGFES